MRLLLAVCLLGFVSLPVCEPSTLKQTEIEAVKALLEDLVSSDDTIDNTEETRQLPKPEEVIKKMLNFADDTLKKDLALKLKYFQEGKDQLAGTHTTEGKEQQAEYTATSFELADDETTFYVAALQALSRITGKTLDELNNDKLLLSLLQTTKICTPRTKYDCTKYEKSRYRSIVGICNNLDNPHWGKTGAVQGRYLPAEYDDKISTPRIKGKNGFLPSARDISNECLSKENKPNVTTPKDPSKTIMIPAWGQFVDHDITLTPISAGYNGSTIACCDLTPPQFLERLQCFPIPMKDDWHFAPKTCLDLVRSTGAIPRPEERKDCQFSVRENFNAITSYMDASNVYGSDIATANSLRKFKRGNLLVYEYKDNDMLPSTSEGCNLDNTGEEKCFHAGDERVNEMSHLSVMHNVFMLEHNRLAKALYKTLPESVQNNDKKELDEVIYQEVRKIIGASMQVIAYSQWLPIVLGKDFMQEHKLRLKEDPFTYNKDIDATIKNVFSTSAFRYGHTTVENYIGNTKPGAHQDRYFKEMTKTDLTNVFFDPTLVYKNFQGIGNWMTIDKCQHGDHFFVDNLRNRLFETNGVGTDLVAINIQRGRDHGLPPYIDFLKFCFPNRDHDAFPFHTASMRQKLKNTYKDLDDVDVFVGGITENVAPGGTVGPTFGCLIGQTFKELRHGDRYWYQNQDDPFTAFTDAQITELEKVTLARIMCTNLEMNTIQKNVFYEEYRCEEENPDNCPQPDNPYYFCDELDDIDITKFTDIVEKEIEKLKATSSRSVHGDLNEDEGLSMNRQRRAFGHYGKH